MWSSTTTLNPPPHYTPFLAVAVQVSIYSSLEKLEINMAGGRPALPITSQ